MRSSSGELAKAVLTIRSSPAFMLPSGISVSLTRRTNSNAVRWKGTRPASNGMLSPATKRSSSALVVVGPRPNGGERRVRRSCRSRGVMVPLPSSYSAHSSRNSSSAVGIIFQLSCSCCFSKFSMMTAVKRLSMMMETKPTKEEKYHCATGEPQFPTSRLQSGGDTLQSFMMRYQSSFVAMRRRTLRPYQKRVKLALWLSPSPNRTSPKSNTPTYA
mmetsp:Transcript_31699/g.56728  ORF Transcript_31699/g.56728 Transcript_31699/m.56728 type:complete len:216 (+) Transcript_31699:1226-1873(+)